MPNEDTELQDAYGRMRAENQKLKEELAAYRLCDDILDSDGRADDGPTYLNIRRLIQERDKAEQEVALLKTTIEQLRQNTPACAACAEGFWCGSTSCPHTCGQVSVASVTIVPFQSENPA